MICHHTKTVNIWSMDFFVAWFFSLPFGLPCGRSLRQTVLYWYCCCCWIDCCCCCCQNRICCDHRCRQCFVVVVCACCPTTRVNCYASTCFAFVVSRRQIDRCRAAWRVQCWSDGVVFFHLELFPSILFWSAIFSDWETAVLCTWRTSFGWFWRTYLCAATRIVCCHENNENKNYTEHFIG